MQDNIKNYLRLFLFVMIGLSYDSPIYGNGLIQNHIYKNSNFNFNQPDRETITYYLYIDDFIQIFIEIPTSNVSGGGSTISSKYLAGRAPLYHQQQKVGTCSASFLCMQNAEGIYTDISNYISVDSGLIVSWLTPVTLINLDLDTIVHSMVTECMVTASTLIGFNPFYGQTFNLIL